MGESRAENLPIQNQLTQRQKQAIDSAGSLIIDGLAKGNVNSIKYFIFRKFKDFIYGEKDKNNPRIIEDFVNHVQQQKDIHFKSSEERQNLIKLLVECQSEE